MVGGRGTARGQSSFDRLTISHSYEKGVQTLSIDGSSMKIIEGGTQLQIGGKTFPVHGKPQTIRLAADGSARSAE